MKPAPFVGVDAGNGPLYKSGDPASSPDRLAQQMEYKSMTKSNSEGQRLPWTTPELKRIEAGSAEAKTNQGIGDGGASPNHKS